MRRLHVPVVLALGLSACMFARSDARIRPGGQVGIATAAMVTPDAETTNPDAPLRGLPEHNDAANVRGVTELFIGYGWPMAELRWHVPLMRWAGGDDFLFSASKLEGPNASVFGSLELYVQALHLGRWSAGVGVESALAAYAIATCEVTPHYAVSATLRGVYLPSGDGEGRAAQIQAQASLTYSLDRDHDLGVFASWITTVGDGPPLTVRIQGGDWFDPGGRSYVEASSFGIVGAMVDWH